MASSTTDNIVFNYMTNFTHSGLSLVIALYLLSYYKKEKGKIKINVKDRIFSCSIYFSVLSISYLIGGVVYQLHLNESSILYKTHMCLCQIVIAFLSIMIGPICELFDFCCMSLVIVWTSWILMSFIWIFATIITGLLSSGWLYLYSFNTILIAIYLIIYYLIDGVMYSFRYISCIWLYLYMIYSIILIIVIIISLSFSNDCFHFYNSDYCPFNDKFNHISLCKLLNIIASMVLCIAVLLEHQYKVRHSIDYLMRVTDDDDDMSDDDITSDHDDMIEEIEMSEFNSDVAETDPLNEST